MANIYFKDITKTDSQIQEIISKNILIHRLLENDFEAAIPVRDCGIDLLVYKKLESSPVKRIQLKSFHFEAFSFDDKYRRIKDLWFVFILNLSTLNMSEKHKIYGMSMAEVLSFIKEANIKSNKKGYYYRGNLTQVLLEKLKPFELVSNGQFRFFFNK